MYPGPWKVPVCYHQACYACGTIAMGGVQGAAGRGLLVWVQYYVAEVGAGLQCLRFIRYSLQTVVTMNKYLTTNYRPLRESKRNQK